MVIGEPGRAKIQGGGHLFQARCRRDLGPVAGDHPVHNRLDAATSSAELKLQCPKLSVYACRSRPPLPAGPRGAVVVLVLDWDEVVAVVCRSGSAPRAQKVRLWCRRPCWMRCCAGDEGLALRRRPAGGDVKPPQAALAEDRRGERWGKGAVMRQVGTGKASVSEPLTTCRNKQLTSEPGRLNGSGMSLAGARLLARRCPAWRRRESGLRPLHGTWEGGCRYRRLGAGRRRGARGSAPYGGNRRR